MIDIAVAIREAEAANDRRRISLRRETPYRPPPLFDRVPFWRKWFRWLFIPEGSR